MPDHRAGRLQQPSKSINQISSVHVANAAGKVSINIIDSALQHVNRVLQIVERVARHDDLLFVETVQSSSVACLKVSLSAAPFAENPGPSPADLDHWATAPTTQQRAIS